MPRYVALLRGINVGGNNLIKMTALKACFEKQGFADVVTYIQSGNVLFSARASGAAKLAVGIEAALAAAFNYQASIVLRSEKEMRAIIARAPGGLRHAAGQVPLRRHLPEGAADRGGGPQGRADEARRRPGARGHRGPLLLAPDQQGDVSRLGKVVAMPMYKSMTIRNWNTTTKLLQMLDAV